MPRASGSKMMMYEQEDIKKGYHKMPGGHMMKDSEMRKKKGKKRNKFAGMLNAKGY